MGRVMEQRWGLVQHRVREETYSSKMKQTDYVSTIVIMLSALLIITISPAALNNQDRRETFYLQWEHV